jgi:hypothetical protein
MCGRLGAEANFVYAQALRLSDSHSIISFPLPFFCKIHESEDTSIARRLQIDAPKNGSDDHHTAR